MTLADLNAALLQSPRSRKGALAAIAEAAKLLGMDTLDYTIRAAVVCSRTVLDAAASATHPTPTEAGEAVPP